MSIEETNNEQHYPHDLTALPDDPLLDEAWPDWMEASAEYDMHLELQSHGSVQRRATLRSELRAYAHENAAFIHVDVGDRETKRLEPIMDEHGRLNEKHLRTYVEDQVRHADAIIKERAAKEALDRIEATAAFNPPPNDYLTFAELLEADLEESAYRVDGLLIHGGNLLLAAEAKAAKTTFMINLVRALLSGEDFLGLGVRPIEEGRRITYWDCELERSYSRAQFAQVGIERTQDLALVPMKGHAPSLMTVTGMEWAIAHLRDRQTDVWIIDTFSRVFDGDENDNSAVTAFLLRLDEIKVRAGVREIYLIHHSGHPSKDKKAPRARGASALQAWPDTNLTITVVNPTIKGDTQRLLECKGRGVTIPEIAYAWDNATNLISPTKYAKVRKDAASKKQRADEAEAAVAVYLKSNRNSKKVDIAKATSLAETAVNKALQAMVERSEAGFQTGDGRNGTVQNAKYYYLINPTDEHE